MGSAIRARGIAACAAIACAFVLPGAAPADGPLAESACTHQDVRVNAANQAQLESSLLCMTNAYRVAVGLAPLALDTRLAAASRAHSEDMVARGYFEHQTPEGMGPDARAAAAGYPGGVGENIAYSHQGTIRVLFEAWRDSPGHEQNMLDPAYRAVGIGLAVGRPGGGGITGGQLFGETPANTAETGLGPAVVKHAAGQATASPRCEAARRTLAARRSAYRKAPWVTPPAKIRRLRAQIRKAKRRCDRACGAGLSFSPGA